MTVEAVVEEEEEGNSVSWLGCQNDEGGERESDGNKTVEKISRVFPLAHCSSAKSISL